MRKLFTLAVLAASLPVFALQAQAIEEGSLASGKHEIAPSNGYIYLEANGRFAGTFIRIPDAEDIAEYRVARAQAFAKEQKRYAKERARWEREVEVAKKIGKALPEEPIEPTEKTFSFGAIEVRNAITFGPDNKFSQDKERGTFSYLTEVKPGTYIWYGPVLYDPKQGHVGLCYCMGSVQFDVRAGAIADLGNFLIAAPQAEHQALAPLLPIQHSGGLNGYKVRLPESSSEVTTGLPPSLASFESYSPEFRASGKLNNFYGVMIARLAPIEGVLSYDRDTVIDVRSGERLQARTTSE